MSIAEVEESASEGKNGKDGDGSNQDLRDQFDDIYDDPLDEEPNGNSDADLEKQMDELKSSSDDAVQPINHSKRTAVCRIKSSSDTLTTTHLCHL